MKKNTYIDLHETILETVLENGMRVFIIEKPEYMTSSFYLAFPYGSMDLNQTYQTQKIEQASGIAHFLEHKLFENNNGTDIMEAFSQLGAHVNAFTSHTETVYTFNISNQRLKKPLNLLLDFVQNLNITEESVEKEKGIIVQELRMYMQMPEQRLMLETYQSLYHQHPIRLDIGGTEDSVNSITKTQLELCYQLNYHPSNSILVCVSSTSPLKLLKLIEDNQKGKFLSPQDQPQRMECHEPESVYRPYFEFQMEIQSSKLTYAYKLNCMSTSAFENLRLEWLLRLYLELMFSPMNPRYQNWIENNRIHDYFGYEVELNDAYGFVLFYGETEDKDDFIQLIHEGLIIEDEALESKLESLKRRYRALLIRSLDDHDDFALNLIRSQFNRIPFEQQFTLLDGINLKEILESQKFLNADNTCSVWMKAK